MSLSWSEVFPAPSEKIPEGDVTSLGTWRLMPCKLCGASIVPSGQARHIDFHEALRIGPLHGWRPRDPQG